MPGPHDSEAACTLDEAREALEAWVKTTRWRRRGIAKVLVIESFGHSGAEHVVFQSFVEHRATTQTYEPHRGGEVDGPERGAAPGAWGMRVDMPAVWGDTRASYEVPHTAVVRTCHDCRGRGLVTCSSCGGRRNVSCSSCGGSGSVSRTRTVTNTASDGQTTTTTEHYTETCLGCCGAGVVTCSGCGGSGDVTCSTCRGARQLRHYSRLDIAWRTDTAEKVLEKTDLPDNLVRHVDGVLELREEEACIEPQPGGGGGPFRGGPTRVSHEVNAAANELIAGHRLGSDEKLHRQRLVVRGVPVHEASYRWRKQTKRFWVYGLEREIHAPDFPVSRTRVAGAIGVSALVVGLIVLVGVLYGSAPPPPALPPPAVKPAAPLTP